MTRNPDNLRQINRTIASVIIISADDQILMGRKSSKGDVYPNAWHIPGGGVEEKESLEQAAKREALEEVGIDLKNTSLKLLPFIGHGESPKTLKTGEQVWVNMTFHRFEARLERVAELVQTRPSDDLIQLRWFTKEELGKIEHVPGGEEFFRKAHYL